MPDTNGQANNIAQLSTRARKHFLSPDVFSVYQTLARECDFNGKIIPSLSTAVYQFVLGSLSKDELVAKVTELTGLESSKQDECLALIGRKILAPIAGDIPGLQEKILALGASKAGEPVSKKTFVLSFITSFPETIEQHLEHRLSVLLTEYLSGSRKRVDLVDYLQRALKLGGLEIDEQAAGTLVDSFDAKRVGVVFVDEEAEDLTEQESVPEIKLESKQKPQTDASVSLGGIDAFSSEDEQEVKEVAEKKQKALLPSSDASPEQLVEEICSDEAFVFSDSAVKNRCMEIVGARAREVRDAFQTRAMIERAVEQGGLGVSGRRLSDMTERIERAVDAAQNTRRASFDADKQAKDEVKRSQKNKRAELAKMEEQLANQEAKIDPRKVKEAIAKTTQNQKLTHSFEAKPRVQDIRSAPQLSGPIDELRGLGLVEFRRLAKNPSQSASRIKDIILLLEDQGYEKRVEGIRAFQSSALMREYAYVTQSALLSGKSVDDVLSQSKDGLNKEEYQSILKLNMELRF